MIRQGTRSAAAMITLLAMIILLPGCLYPDDQLAKQPAKDAILNVQTVIDQYQKDTGLLPIQNSDQDTPIYEKYLIDFAKLQRMNYLTSIPETAYEKGGSYYYLIINEETDPTVKLMNLVIYQQVNDVQAAVKTYRSGHNGELPSSDEAYPDFVRIDYKKLAVKEPVIRSMFTGQTLYTLMDAKGNVYIDYGSDIMQAIEKAGGKSIAPAQDLRGLLVNNADFVPVKSPVYHLINGEPQAVLK
ncbi:hypothetical protein ACFOLF_05365 [Paenibacillus sepulcri]|uniref:Uncharacterized protein n=1 Tax=Paenibacillus sepulcri TaxID=359917 RepID=A0ABS7C4B5_9BACL|nr:hypothetical protein [Paenibacillus sepulcri]